MNALLLAAGFGTRLGKLTKSRPKCLMRVGEQTILDHWLHKLDKLGVSSIVINTHYLAEQITAFTSNHPLREKIILSYESELLGTAGTVAANSTLLQGQDSLIAHADNYCEDSLEGFWFAHTRRPKKTILSMLTFTTATPHNCGIVEVDKKNRLTKFYEKTPNPPSNRANAAVYITSSEFFKTLGCMPTQNADISCDIIPRLLGKIYCFHTAGFFEDIGSPRTLKKVNEYLS
jgi:mannose-1-phosphate guanylyltransferase